jgi:cyclic beta-1,2-glucan synthetase
VVPTLLSRPSAIDELCEALEVSCLANRDQHIHFALLTDFLDAATENCADDEELLQLIETKIAALNEKYERSDLFFLMHRPRTWNARERVWMGYERKRGKLANLNAFLRDGDASRFSRVVGDTTLLADVKYVITLDTDTQLPRDSARELIAAIAHPLNRAQFAAGSTANAPCRIIAGYAILQPLVAMSITGANASRYAKLSSPEAGIDPYTRTVADVYQNLFKEGSFIGKGIYDVDAFERALAGRIPDNRILSHDLLEGCIARSGLLSDSQLYEEYPPQYSADVRRRRRWIRGDWQLLGWLLPHLSSTFVLSTLSRWKIFDNLLRSLNSTALLLLLLFGWLASVAPEFWTIAVLVLLFFPALCVSILHLLRKPTDTLLLQHLVAVARAALNHFAQMLLTLVCIPFDAYFSVGAIIVTLTRMTITRRGLLEWASSSEVERNRNNSFAESLRTMWFAPVGTLALIVYLAASASPALRVALPILLLWLFSPLITWWISRPLSEALPKLDTEQLFFLRKMARRTWGFFEEFVVAEQHWLPPDNYQHYRGPVIAPRTSPTNIGLALLANVTAHDFGYIPSGMLLERTAKTLTTMSALERYQGHFYNWYDTTTLQPLHPIYISSVDSGNLAGHLLVLRQALLALIEQPLVSPQWFSGVQDTLGVVQDLLVQNGRGDDNATVLRVQALLNTAEPIPLKISTALQYFEKMAQSALTVADDIIPLTPVEHGTRDHKRKDKSTKERSDKQITDNDTKWWADALVFQCRVMCDELRWLMPWSSLSVTHSLDSELLSIADTAFDTTIKSLGDMARAEEIIYPLLDRAVAAQAPAASAESLARLRQSIAEAGRRARARIVEIQRLAEQIHAMSHMQYDFLFDKTRRLLAIGYNVSERRLDTSFYDLLASEARMAVFVAIAQRQVPQESWFVLGRLLVGGGAPVLMSWSGSMFEYLMPLLVMPAYTSTLLDQTNKAAVSRQIEYGKLRGVPWGISESGYNHVDTHSTYQYHAFGVPGLGLKRGLKEDLVVAPYASALALMVAPEAACANLQRLSALGMQGKFGFYEAIDFTASRQRRNESSAIVYSFMAHHQGMSLLALAYLLLRQPMQRRFEADLLLQSASLLLQERIPKATAIRTRVAELTDLPPLSNNPEMPVRIFNTANTPNPEVQLLSNGRYHVMITNAGGGYSRWQDLAVTRWREDSTCDNWGTFCYIRDVATGEFWSTALQPALQKADNYQVIFSEGRVEFRRSDHGFDTYTEIVVSPEDDIELRRMHITNTTRARRVIEVTSYAEVVIASAAADAAHPAFSNLFVQTEIVSQRQAILCSRRPRSQDEATPWMLHLLAVHGADVQKISYETDRRQFIGRGNTLAHPAAMNVASLSGNAGSVLDPIVAIRYRLTIEPDQSVTIDMVTGMGETRELAMGLIEKYQDRHLADRVFDLAWTHSQVLLRQLNASEADAQLYGRLANSIIYTNASLRAEPSVLIKNRRGQSGLWAYAISGDLPIVLLQIQNSSNIELVRQLVQAHAYWRLKGLAVDLVIWNEDHAGYRQALQEQILGLIGAGTEAHVIDRPGGIFVRPAEQIANEDRILLQTVARIIITDNRGTLAEQINRRPVGDVRVPKLELKPSLGLIPARAADSDITHAKILDNGLGGFSQDGREYVITLAPGRATPAPWANVLANPHFGCVISESGGAYTWNENAHEFRLTPWYNDAVCDRSGEAFYVRDEDSGEYWSPTPLPCRGANTYVCRHGFGYSVFEYSENGIESELTVFVAADATIKFSILKLRNTSERTRKLSATGFVEWVLGDLRPKTAQHVVLEIEPNTGALCANNPYSNEFPEGVAFFDVGDIAHSFSGDRNEFLGRNGTQRKPAALARSRLSGKVGVALDACAALQVPIELPPGHEREIIFRLGFGGNSVSATELIQKFRSPTVVHAELENVQNYWRHTLSAVQIETPDIALNMLTNGWLMYQVIASRLWARSGYYQSGGAFGFRDQLQDAMALIHTEPHRLRAQLLLSASRQFSEGDVQHWWHPPSGRGVRTHCSDDFLWLPLAASRYVLSTGDTGVLNEVLAFLSGRPVNEGDDSYYDLPGHADETASLYQHCVRAIRHGLRFGEHGLPLIGSGDWNDGMNLVGIDGKGESIWLGFFLCQILTQFAKVASLHGDAEFAALCVDQGKKLHGNINAHGWDGAWYRRAYFDDGAVLGSASNDECQIDSISQSWSVLSNTATVAVDDNDENSRARSRIAMDAVYKRLVRKDAALIQLLDPPFDRSHLNPGYIKGYVPGVRENGGQYTHAAIWAAMAFAQLGDSERAWELLRMINPVLHGLSAETIATYKVEPYVIAADVYAVAPHVGRGGWSWYTGSAGWMYRLITESLLGIRLEVDKLYFAPCLPKEWPSFQMQYRFRQTTYHIEVTQITSPINTSSHEISIMLDGNACTEAVVILVDDGEMHTVKVTISL